MITLMIEDTTALITLFILFIVFLAGIVLFVREYAKHLLNKKLKKSTTPDASKPTYKGEMKSHFYSAVFVKAGNSVTLFDNVTADDNWVLTRYYKYSDYALRCLGREGDFYRVLFRKWQWFDPTIPTFDIAYIHISEGELVQLQNSVYYWPAGEYQSLAPAEIQKARIQADNFLLSGLFFVIPDHGSSEASESGLSTATVEIQSPIANGITPPTMVRAITQPQLLYIPPDCQITIMDAHIVYYIEAIADNEALETFHDMLPAPYEYMQRQNPEKGIVIGMVEGSE